MIHTCQEQSLSNSVYTDQKIFPQAKVELQPTVEKSVTQTCRSDFYQDNPFRILHGWHTTLPLFKTEAEGRLSLPNKD